MVYVILSEYGIHHFYWNQINVSGLPKKVIDKIK